MWFVFVHSFNNSINNYVKCLCNQQGGVQTDCVQRFEGAVYRLPGGGAGVFAGGFRGAVYLRCEYLGGGTGYRGFGLGLVFFGDPAEPSFRGAWADEVFCVPAIAFMFPV